MLTTEKLKNCHHVHFVGIGGVGMSALAQWLHMQGKKVTGSDRTKSVFTDKLEGIGIKIGIPYAPNQVRLCDLLVTNSAISCDDSEVLLAKSLGVPVVTRSQLLGIVFDDFAKNVAVCGMHGKTTTSGMLAHCLCVAQKDPTAFVGGECHGFGNFLYGKSDFCVAEACEYKANFLTMHPYVTCVLNIDHDHPDFFKDKRQVVEVFSCFAKQTKSGGVVVANGDQKETRLLADVTFGFGKNNDYQAQNLSQKGGVYDFCIYKKGKPFCKVSLSVPGLHNVYNALCVVATLDFLGIPPDDICRGITSFCGVDRRCTVYNGKTKVVVDYAHHPNEIKSFLNTIKHMGFDRTFLVFQPHTYTRTQALFDDFVKVLCADEIFVLPTYSARENKIEGCDGIDLATALQKQGKKATFAYDRQNLAQLLQKNANANDVILLVGAGDVDKIKDLLM